MATLVQAVRLALHYGEDAPRRHRRLRRGRRPAARRRLHRHAGAQDRLELAARRARHHRHGDGHRLRRRPAGLRDPVLRLRLQHHRPAQGRRQSALGRRPASYDMPIVVMTPTGSGIRGSLYHSHCFESWASRLAGWKIVMPSQRPRRLRPDALGHRRSEPGAGAAAQGAAAGRRRRGCIPGEPADDEELSRMIDAPVGDRSELEAAVAGRARSTSSRSAQASWSARGPTARSSATAGRCRCACRPPTNWPASTASRST